MKTVKKINNKHTHSAHAAAGLFGTTSQECRLQQAQLDAFAIHGDYNFVLQTMQRSRDSKTFERVEQVYTSVQALAQQIDDLYRPGRGGISAGGSQRRVQHRNRLRSMQLGLSPVISMRACCRC